MAGLDATLLSWLRCPRCKGELHAGANGLVCTSFTCRLEFPIRHEIAVLVPQEARTLNDGDWQKALESQPAE